jgi:hypothetical protein
LPKSRTAQKPSTKKPAHPSAIHRDTTE